MAQEIKIHDQHRHHHVAVLAFPFGTHAAPLLSIIHYLAPISPHTLFSFFNTQKSNTSIFSAMTLPPNVKAYNVWEGFSVDHVLSNPLEEIDLFLKSAPGSFMKAIEVAVKETRKKVTCLITDAFFWFAADMAEGMSVPWVPLWTAGPHALAIHVCTDLIRQSVGVGSDVKGKEDETLTVEVPDLSRIRTGDLPEGVVVGDLDSVFSVTLHKMGIALPRAAAVLINSFEELSCPLTDHLKSKFKMFLNIGPFNMVSGPPLVSDAHSCLPWLDSREASTVVYISFGSRTVPPPHELVAIAEALEATKSRFIWSLKESAWQLLPNGFIERNKQQGIIVPWAPQLQILSHTAIRVFVTHCGWNSILESIIGGVPLICRPFFGDQRLNGRIVQDVWQVGLQVENAIFTKSNLIYCLDQVTVKETGNIFKDNIASLKELAYKAVGPNGSSKSNLRALYNLISPPKQ